MCDVIAGQSPESKFYNVDGRGVPFYQGKKDFGEKYVSSATVWTTEVTKVAQEGDILMSVRAPVGPINFTRGEICIGRGLAAIRPKPDLDKDFLFYQLCYRQPEIAGKSGAIFASINKSEIAALPVWYVPIVEQRRIVEILDRSFGVISTAARIIEKNIQNSRDLFQACLHQEFSKSTEQVTLEELATDVTDGDHSPPPKAALGVPFITISNVDRRTRTIDFSDTFYVSQKYFDSLKSNKKPRIGDILYTVTGATLGTPVLLNEDRDFCFQRHIGLIRPKASVDGNWLHYALLSPQTFRQATLGSTGAAQKTVSLRVLRNLKVPKIDVLEQKRVASNLDALFAETHKLQTVYSCKLAALDELKKSLLHQAFSGNL